MGTHIGLGLAAIGRPQYINIRNQAVNTPFDKVAFIEKGKKLLTSSYEEGIRHFDAAPGYGIAEQILLEWMSENQPKAISVSTKWGYTYAANFDPHAEKHEVKEHSLSKLNEQWAFSSQLLPYLTIYQIHSATLESGVLENGPVLERLMELKESYKFSIGLSVSGSNQDKIIQKALSINISGNQLFDSFQVTYNLFDQTLLSMMPLLEGKKVIVKEALANGRILPNKQYPHYRSAYDLLRRLSIKYQVGIDAIALRFCIDSIAPYLVLSGAAEEEHLIANLKANHIQLSDEYINELKGLSVSSEPYWAERKELLWN